MMDQIKGLLTGNGRLDNEEYLSVYNVMASVSANAKCKMNDKFNNDY